MAASGMLLLALNGAFGGDLTFTESKNCKTAWTGRDL